MLSIKVHTENNDSFGTLINGDELDIWDYYTRQPINMGNNDKDCLTRVMRIEFQGDYHASSN